jgi:hypothetical protein
LDDVTGKGTDIRADLWTESGDIENSRCSLRD